MANLDVEFWLEYGSTYSYLSVMRIAALATQAKVNIKWRPFLLMPLFVNRGLSQGPFLPYPDKLNYMWRDLERRAAHHGLPYRKPSIYPPNTLLTARIGLLMAADGSCQKFSEGVFRRHWQKGVYIGTNENIRDVLLELGKDPDEVIARALTNKNKKALREQTKKAESLGSGLIKATI